MRLINYSSTRKTSDVPRTVGNNRFEPKPRFYILQVQKTGSVQLNRFSINKYYVYLMYKHIKISYNDWKYCNLELYVCNANIWGFRLCCGDVHKYCKLDTCIIVCYRHFYDYAFGFIHVCLCFIFRRDITHKSLLSYFFCSLTIMILCLKNYWSGHTKECTYNCIILNKSLCKGWYTCDLAVTRC